MNRDFLASFILALSKETYGENEKRIIEIGRNHCENMALNYVLQSKSEILYTIYQGHCVNKSLLTNFNIKKWLDNDVLFRRTLKIVRESVPQIYISEVCKVLRMLYFTQLVQRSLDKDLHTIHYLFNQIFNEELQKNISTNKRFKKAHC